MLSKDKTETSPIVKAVGSTAKIVAAGIGGESAVFAVSAMGRLFKLFGAGRVRIKEANAAQAEHMRGAKIEDLRDE